MTRVSRMLGLVGICTLLMACSISFPSSKTAQSTSVAATIEAELTMRALSATPTSTATTVPTATTEPSVTPTLTTAPTNTPAPSVVVITPAPQASCYAATFVSDVTIPDGLFVDEGGHFIKTWRVQNSGTCAWSGYQLVFQSGDRMSSPDSIPQSGVINPGSTVDVSVSLLAPTSPGSYTGYFKLRASDGTVFGMGPYNSSLSVVIATKSLGSNPPGPTPFPSLPPPPAPILRPDMRVTDFSINSGQPIPADVPVLVRISVMNKGDAKAGPFIVEFWGLETFANRSCIWEVDSMNVNGGRVLECMFTFQSSYADGLKAKVWIDRPNAVNEHYEDNNIHLVPLDFK